MSLGEKKEDIKGEITHKAEGYCVISCNMIFIWKFTNIKMQAFW
jgi:hypothetical protein